MKLRIDELAQRSGTSSRTIRDYQAKGLLPPPELEGRTGYYDEEHLRRLELIDDLQDRGFSLAAIQQTLEAWASGGDLSHLIGFHNVLAAPWGDEEPAIYSAEELFERFPEARERPGLVQEAIDQELIVPADQDGSFRAPSPMLIDAGGVLVGAGVPLEEVLAVIAEVRADMADVAARLVDLVAEHVVLPVASPDAADADVEEALDTLRRLRPVALEVVRPFLAQELERAIERAVREVL